MNILNINKELFNYVIINTKIENNIICRFYIQIILDYMNQIIKKNEYKLVRI